MRRYTCTADYSHNFIFREALLGFFRAQVEFQEDIDDPAVSHGPGGDSLQQVQGIYGLHQRYIGQDQLELIGLQMADEMPTSDGSLLLISCKLSFII